MAAQRTYCKVSLVSPNCQPSESAAAHKFSLAEHEHGLQQMRATHISSSRGKSWRSGTAPVSKNDCSILGYDNCAHLVKLVGLLHEKRGKNTL